MLDRPSQDELIYPAPEAGSEGRLVDLPEGNLEPLRTARRRKSGPIEDGAVVSLRDRDRDDTGPQRVGGRRRFRPEVLLVLAGSVFLAAALLKPWPSAPYARSPSSAPTGAPTEPATAAPADLAAAVATPAATALRSPVGWPHVPQWDYGWPVPDATQPAQQGNSGTAADPRWSAVDWTVLSTIDPHDGWGYGAAIMPDLAQLPPQLRAPSPVTTWVEASSPRYTTITVGRGSQVFGLAITWPHSIQVRSVTVGYIGGPDHPANMPPAGFPAYAQVSPLPAAQVASSSGVAVGAQATATTRQAVGAGGTIWSGQFWIPPSAASSGAASASIPNAWRSQPWPWPDGIYSITITSTAGMTSYLLTLQAS
jgi:hypothetical protein